MLMFLEGKQRDKRTRDEPLLAEIERQKAHIAKLEEQVAQLTELAYQDPLIALPNRRMLVVQLEQVIARVERHGTQGAIVFVDVDGLKRINDRFGHDAGDQALIEVGRLLNQTVRATDCVARIGGDEFAILLEHVDALGAWQMALRLVEAVVGARFCVDKVCLPLSVAVGVAEIKAGDQPEAVLKRADQEMYRVKAA